MYEQIKKTLSVKYIVTLVVILSLVFGLALRFVCYPIFLLLTPEIQNRNMANKVFKYLDSGEAEKFSELFCDAAQSDPNFQSNIQAIFSYFDGDFTDESWERIRDTNSFNYGKSIDYGKLTEMHWSTNYKDIVTTSGGSFTFYLSWYLIDDAHPEYEGIEAFTIQCTDDDVNNYVGILTSNVDPWAGIRY